MFLLTPFFKTFNYQFDFVSTSLILNLGWFFNGTGITFVSCAWLPLMVGQISSHLIYEEDVVEDIASSLFTSMYGFGEMAGPIIGGVFTDKIDFSWDLVIFIIIIAVNMFSVIVLKIRQDRKVKKES